MALAPESLLSFVRTQPQTLVPCSKPWLGRCPVHGPHTHTILISQVLHLIHVGQALVSLRLGRGLRQGGPGADP